MSISVVLIYNHSVPRTFIFPWCWLARIVHIANPHAHPPGKDMAHNIYNAHSIALLPISVESSTRSAFHGDVLILGSNCVSISSAISSIRLVTVLVEKGTCVLSFEQQPLLKCLHCCKFYFFSITCVFLCVSLEIFTDVLMCVFARDYCLVLFLGGHITTA